MKEDFLHYLWRTRRFNPQNLRTTTGELVIIQQVGEHNQHAGPDFTNARLKIGETLWAGNVEIHLRASEWYAHKHEEDPAYDSVILHVVLEEDTPVLRANGAQIPCLELRRRVPPGILQTYQKLLRNESWIPCEPLFDRANEITRDLWLDRLLVERLEYKTQEIARALKQEQHHWEVVFYRFLSRSFGLKINTEPFELLARATPLSLLLKHKDSLLQIEALLFGQAGMLERDDFSEKYPDLLRKEYRFLQKKYQLKPIPASAWKFMRLRPANFPTIRIAQLAQLIYQSNHLFSKILAIKNLKEMENMFCVQLSNYWQNHYVFGKTTQSKVRTLGRSTIHLMVINTIAPFLFLYGQQRDEATFKEKAMSLLEALKPEKNSLIEHWKDLGLNPVSAYQSQALLQLKNQYCDRQRCTECAIGHAILKEA